MSKVPTAPSPSSYLSTVDGTAIGDLSGSTTASALETAMFVVDFTTELSSLARKSRLDLLAYLLDMARLEAIRVVQAHHREP